MRFEIYYVPSEEFIASKYPGGWYWRLKARNGRVVADGAEGYASERNVRRAIRRLDEAMAAAIEPFEIVVTKI